MSVHLLGIRHHGPGSARSVVRALDELAPDAVLVESPADTAPALAWIGRDGLVPPVALLGHVVDAPNRAVFAPFASFSPEWQAVRWAAQHDVPFAPIDLPLAVSLAGSLAGSSDDGPTLLASSAPVDPLAALAAAAGEDDPERWWEDVVEHRGEGLPAFEAVAEAMTAVRDGTFTSPGEERREAHMRRAIRATVRSGAATVAVVCGAWHVPGLDLAADSASADAATLRGLPRTKVGVSWVPWTHRRLSSSTGYGAGVRSPGWYDHVHRHPGPEGVARFFVDAAQVLRSAGMSASPDHLIAASRLADTLAILRDRPRPGLDEVLDAADTVMGGLPLVREQLVVGRVIGEVPPAAPQVPLARDLATQQRRVRLAPRADAAVVELDLRAPNGRARSQLLHRVEALGLGWGSLTEGRGSSGTFRETWRVAWEPELSVRVVELAAYGTTVERAATVRLVERAGAATSLAEIAHALDAALLAELPDAVEPVVRRLSDRAATDPDLGQLMGALGPLAQAMRYGDVRDTDASSLRTVFDGLVVRILAGAPAACASLDDDAASVMIERLSGVQAALALVDHPARRSQLPALLARLADGTVHGLVQGRAARLLHDGGQWDAATVGRRLGRALSAGTPPTAGAAFVEGFVAGSGTVLVHDTELLDIVDRWLSSLGPDAFTDTVVLLRRTFGAFEPAERRQLGRLVAGRGREQVAGFAPDVDARRVAAALATMRPMLGLAIPDGEAVP